MRQVVETVEEPVDTRRHLEVKEVVPTPLGVGIKVKKRPIIVENFRPVMMFFNNLN